MVLPSPPSSISMSQVNVELGSPSTTLRALNDAAVRNLAGKPTPASQISMSDLYGKSSFTAITATASGTVTPLTSGNYQLFVFTGPGTLSVSNAGTTGEVDYLVVAGGGGGGGHILPTVGSPPGVFCGASGGGGAGGLRTGTLTVTATSYPITVGGGGAAGPVPSQTNGTNGGPSTFHTITSAGGGGGAGGNNAPGSVNPLGSAGGSGGGSIGGAGGGAGNTPPTTPPQGNNGSYGATGIGGGGGGAGGNGGYTDGGSGRLIPWVTGLPVPYGSPTGYFSGGGGGSGGATLSSSIYGGGGEAPPRNGTPVTDSRRNGTTNTGGGGVGASAGPAVGSYEAGTGGSGIVVIRYRLS